MYVSLFGEVSIVTIQFSPAPSKASAISLPSSLSLFADIVETLYNSLLSTLTDLSAKKFITCSLNLSIPFFTFLNVCSPPFLVLYVSIIACVSTMEVVVPSPATEAVFVLLVSSWKHLSFLQGHLAK